jgi:signal transduction histidine kinase
MMNDIDVPGLQRTVQELQSENERLRAGYASLSQRLIGLRMLQHITLDLVSELELDRLLKRILRSAIHAVEGTAGAVILLDPHGEALTFAVVEGGGGEALQGQRMARDQGIAGWVVCHNEPVIVTDAQEDERYFADIPAGVGFEVTSMICAPLVTRGKPIGVVQVLNKVDGAHFDDDDLDLMTSFAAQSAAAIENARLYQELKRERDRIVAVEEEIRRRLARDIHDGPAQMLAAIIVNIEFIRRLLDREPDKVLNELDNLMPLAHKALRQLRTLLFDLRPVILETQGLVPALEAYVQRQQEAAPSVEPGLVHSLEATGFSGRLVPHAERAIFGIIQEAVGNVRKHARARHVWILLAQQGDNLAVEIRDDGCGFDVEHTRAGYDQRGSLGMLNMEERAAAIGGELSIYSRPGSGTSVTLLAPLASLRQSSPTAAKSEPEPALLAVE